LKLKEELKLNRKGLNAQFNLKKEKEESERREKEQDFLAKRKRY